MRTNALSTGFYDRIFCAVVWRVLGHTTDYRICCGSS
jgi:hypothetical protein